MNAGINTYTDIENNNEKKEEIKVIKQLMEQ